MINDYAIIILLFFYEKMAPVELLCIPKRGINYEDLQSNLNGMMFDMYNYVAYITANEHIMIYEYFHLLPDVPIRLTQRDLNQFCDKKT